MSVRQVGCSAWDPSTSFACSPSVLGALQVRFADLAAHQGEAERIVRQGDGQGPRDRRHPTERPLGPHLALAVGARRRDHWSMGFVTDTDTNGGKAHLMRKLLTLSLALALTALLTVTGLVVYGDDDGTEARQGTTSSDPSTGSRQKTMSTSAEPEAVAPARPVRASGDPMSPPAAQAPEPSDGGCSAAALRDAIAASDAVGDDVTFEIRYLNCGEGYGWAQIVADYGEGATVLFKGSGADIALLNLGGSVCALDSGMPASVADRLAPPGAHWLGECGL